MNYKPQGQRTVPAWVWCGLRWSLGGWGWRGGRADCVAYANIPSSSNEPVVFLGDSNLNRVLPFRNWKIQVHGYPGANFYHFFLTSWRCRWSVGRPAWWFSKGLNNKDQDPEKASVKQLRRALSKSLTKTQTHNLTTMNNFICTHFNYLTCIPQQYFHTTVDGVNWTEETAARVFNHCCKSLQRIWA